MSEVFKKGQLVPKRLGILSFSDEKARHGVIFGFDVEINGKFIKALSDGPVFFIRRSPARKMKNGTRKKSSFVMRGGFSILGFFKGTSGITVRNNKRIIQW